MKEWSQRRKSFLTNYLKNWQQQVNLNGALSDLKPIDFGVPQGGILGPLLFIIFVNDLPSHQFPANIHTYAEDTVLYYRNSQMQCKLWLMLSKLIWINFLSAVDLICCHLIWKKTNLIFFIVSKKIPVPCLRYNGIMKSLINFTILTLL